jgi:hypothetical protein
MTVRISVPGARPVADRACAVNGAIEARKYVDTGRAESRAVFTLRYSNR